MKRNRYIQTKHVGIRKDSVSGRYQANITINGKRLVKSFDRITDAKKWRMKVDPQMGFFLKLPTLNEVWEEHIESSSSSFVSRETKSLNYEVFRGEIGHLRMNEITPGIISECLRDLKRKALSENSRRYSFDRPLKELRTIFNWYNERNKDIGNPVKRFLFKNDSKIKHKPKKRKYLTEMELANFIGSFNSDYFRSFATLQLLCAARVGEVAGLQVEDIDLDGGFITICRTVVWSKSKKFVELKDFTKNGEIKRMRVTDKKMLSWLKELIGNRANGYLFSINGKALSYRKIQHHYDYAKRRAGIKDVAGSTHMLRHTAATIVRSELSLDAAQALTGHKSIEQIQVYASLDFGLQASAQSLLSQKFLGDIG